MKSRKLLEGVRTKLDDTLRKKTLALQKKTNKLWKNTVDSMIINM